MAGEGAIGSTLVIPKELLDDINRADGLIKKLAETSEETEKRVQQAFKNMAADTKPFENALKAIADKLGGIDAVKLASAADAMDKTAQATRSAADAAKDLKSNYSGVGGAISRAAKQIDSAAASKSNANAFSYEKMKSIYDAADPSKLRSVADRNTAIKQLQEMWSHQKDFKGYEQIFAAWNDKLLARINELKALNQAAGKTTEQKNVVSANAEKKVLEDKLRLEKEWNAAHDKHIAERNAKEAKAAGQQMALEEAKKQRTLNAEVQSAKYAEERHAAEKKAILDEWLAVKDARENERKQAHANHEAYLKEVEARKAAEKKVLEQQWNAAADKHAANRQPASTLQPFSVKTALGDYQAIQSEIDKTAKRQQELTNFVKNYEAELARIKTGKGGVLLNDAETKKAVEAAKQELPILREKQNELEKEKASIIRNAAQRHQAYQQQLQMLAAIKAYPSEEERYKKDMAAMRAYYEAEEIAAKKNAELRAARAAQNRANNYATNTSYEGALKFADNANTLNRQKVAIDYLTEARNKLSKSDSDYASKVETLNQRINQLTQQTKEAKMTTDQLAEARQKAKAKMDKLNAQNIAKSNSTFEGAMKFAEGASSIAQRTQAIKYLSEARSQLSKTDADYNSKLNALNSAIRQMNAENKKAIAGSKELHQNHSKLLNTTEQLKRQFALMFSVSQIKGYLQNIVKVRSEMELQHVALTAIIQDRDKADKIFSQVKNLALQSPFKVGQLVTFTKQLAAYRIETDKLYDRTKRLADVSAGLGVDMQRLILAYGQIKAAAYLRGTEVRQLTEAGINVYGELQNYFKDVKGEDYTTGEIVKMISAKKVTFEDIDQVFKRMTDSGGMFYKMQEKQSETLYGQIEKTKDAFYLMENAIGENYQGFISAIVDTIQAVIRNWRTVATVMGSLIAGYTAYKTVAMSTIALEAVQTGKLIGLKEVLLALKGKDAIAGAIANSQKKLEAAIRLGNTAAINAETAAQNRLNAAMAINPWALAVGAVLAVGVAIYGVIKDINHLNNELENIKMEGVFNASMQASDYKRLASIVADGTKSYKEHSEAISELRRKYSEILPEQYLNEEGIKSLKGNYDAATQSIYDYVEAKTREKEMETVNSEYGQTLMSDEKNLTKQIQRQLDKTYKIKTNYAEIHSIVSKLREELQSGSVSIDNAENRLRELIKESTGLDASRLKFYTRGGDITSGTNYFREYISTYAQMQSKIDEINNGSASAYRTVVEKQLDPIKEDIQKTTAEAISAINTIQTYEKDKSLVSEQELNQAYSTLSATYRKLGLEAVDFKAIMNDSFKLNDETIKVNSAFVSLLEKQIKKLANAGRLPAGSDTTIAKYLENIRKEAESFAKTPMQTAVENFIHNFEKLNKVNISQFFDLMIKAEESTEDFVKRMKTLAETLTQELIKNESSAFPEYGLMSAQQKADTEHHRDAALAIAEAYAIDEKARKAEERKRKKLAKESAKNERDIWQERIDTLEKMHQRYESIRKMLGEKAASEDVRKNFANAIKESGLSKDIVGAYVPTKEGLMNALKKVYKSMPAVVATIKKRNELQQKISELKVEIDQENLQKSLDEAKRKIDEAFDGLSLRNKLFDIGVYDFEIGALGPLFKGLPRTFEEVRNKMLEAYKITPEMAAMSDKMLENVIGTDKFKQYISDREKLQKQEADHQRSIVEQLVKDYKNKLADQLAIDLWYARERQKIQENVKDPELAKELNYNLDKRYKEKTDEQAWKDFQDTDMYIRLFENLDHASSAALSHMRSRLDEMRNSLSELKPAQVRAIVSQMDKLDEQLVSKNPLSSLVDGAKDYFSFLLKRKSLEEQLFVAETQQLALQKQEREQSMDVEAAKQNLNDVLGDPNATQGQIELARQRLQIAQQNLGVTRGNLKSVNLTTSALQKQVREGQKAKKKLDSGYEKTREFLRGMGDNAKQLASLWSDDVAESIGETVDNVFAVADGVKNLIDTVDVSVEKIIGGIETTVDAASVGMQTSSTTASASIKAIESASAILAIISAAIQLATAVANLFNKDKKKQKEIEELQAKVDALQHSYEKLKKSMDDAYSTANLIKYKDESIKNLKAQQAAYEAMAKAEEAKKKKDKDKIREYRQNAEDLNDTIKELSESMTESLGAFGSQANYKSAAQAFTEAWVDAFNEGENTLDALNSKFNEYFNTLLKRQLTNRAASRFITPILEAFDAAVAEGSEGGNKGTDVTKNELDRLKRLKDENLKGYNDYLYQLTEMLGVDPNNSASLSALQQGIQGITENTAEALESLLNSIRFFVATQQADVAIIRELMQLQNGVNGQQQDNPMLNELRSQTVILRNMESMWDRVIRPDTGGWKLNVKI